MRLLVPILILSLLVSACKKDSEETSSDFNGVYSGSFSRTGMDTAYVLLELFDNKFEGESDREKYPAICHGSFDMDQNTIAFVDSCTWTADFDWSLILNGTYNLSFQSDNTLRIWRTNGTVMDEYILRKRQR